MNKQALAYPYFLPHSYLCMTASYIKHLVPDRMQQVHCPLVITLFSCYKRLAQFYAHLYKSIWSPRKNFFTVIEGNMEYLKNKKHLLSRQGSNRTVH